MSDFDPGRFEELVEKAENDTLTDAEVDELAEQLGALQDVLGEIVEVIVELIEPMFDLFYNGDEVAGEEDIDE